MRNFLLEEHTHDFLLTMFPISLSFFEHNFIELNLSLVVWTTSAESDELLIGTVDLSTVLLNAVFPTFNSSLSENNLHSNSILQSAKKLQNYHPFDLDLDWIVDVQCHHVTEI